MLKHVFIEWLKLRRNSYFWLFILITPIISIVITYLLASGFQFKTTENAEVASWQMWKSASSIFFNLHYLLFTIFGGLLLIAWQHQEHQDNTFKIYEVVPINLFVALAVRFFLYYLACAIVFVVCLTIGLKVIEWVWIEKYNIYSKYLVLNKPVWIYLSEKIKALIVMPISIYAFLFLFSLKNTNISVSILALVSSILLGFLSLSDWLFFGHTQESFRIINSLYSNNNIYSLQDLHNIYIYNALTLILIFFIVYLLSKQKILFNKII